MEENSKKPEISEKTKKRKAKIAVISLAAIIVILLGLQVYASTNGYGNMFFMIKEWITGDVSGKDNLLSDKDITLSYKSIDLTDNLKIQANRIEIKDGKTKIYLTVKPLTEENIPLKYTVYTNIDNKKEIEGIKPQTISDYQDILELDYEVREDDLITMEIRNKDNKELKTLEINLKTREILVKGEDDIGKISEIELKKYLNLFSELNNESGKENALIYIAKNLQENYKDFMDEEDYQYRMDKSTDRAYKNAIIKEFYGDNAEFEYKKQKNISLPEVEVLKGITAWEFDKENDSYKPLTAGEEYRHGKCLKVEDISYEGGIYTIKYVYLLYTGYDEEADRLEELPQYETTIKLKRIEDNLYSKYQIVSLENGTELKNKVSTDDEENEDIFKDASTLNYTSNFKDSENGKIAILKSGEKEFKTTQKDGYYTYTDMYGNSYDIKKIKNIDSKFEMTNKDNNVALFRCTITYLDNNDYFKSFDVAVTIPNNFDGIFMAGNYLSYTGSTAFTKFSGIYDDSNETNQNTNTEIDYHSEVENWKQIWPGWIGMKFKCPNNFEIEKAEPRERK